MPKLIKGISASVLDHFIGETPLYQPLEGQVGQGDYIEIYGITAFLQDWSKVVKTTELPKLTNYGLKNTTSFYEIKISY
jgi:hypothetical protein